MRQLTFILGILILTITSAQASISVSPVAVYLTHVSRTGDITVRNTTDGPLLIKLDLKFGYPVSDSVGNVTMYLTSDSTYNERSSVPWMYLYPRRFMLYPRQMRTVRIIARPPSNLPDGEYWCRVEVTSEKSVSADSLARRKSATASVDINFSVVVPIIYRKGTVSPDASLLRTSYSQTDKSVDFLVDAQPTTQAAYIGNLICQVLTNDGRLVAEKKVEIALYTPMRRRFEFDRSTLPPGEYKLKIIFNTDRPEERGNAIFAEPRSYIKDFSVR